MDRLMDHIEVLRGNTLLRSALWAITIPVMFLTYQTLDWRILVGGLVCMTVIGSWLELDG
jgi:hypothetical protein